MNRTADHRRVTNSSAVRFLQLVLVFSTGVAGFLLLALGTASDFLDKAISQPEYEELGAAGVERKFS
ncbi:hypothetical protein [Nocardia sp. NBC_00403]|uniref:hypothetical protein n=1 Tax=Nocardia sp. NBC_00403 TaxID=2975990 RepID=UPI002E20197D